jgi:outer membrane protein TolC
MALFQGGSRWYDRNAALGQKKSIDAELLAARNHLVAKVSETYYRWLQSFGFVEVAEKALESARTDEEVGRRVCRPRWRCQ